MMKPIQESTLAKTGKQPFYLVVVVLPPLLNWMNALVKAFFSLDSDGSREDPIKIKAGGYRYPSTPETVVEKVIDEHGNMWREEHEYMEGTDVFNFVLRKISPDIKRMETFSGKALKSLDYYLKKK